MGTWVSSHAMIVSFSPQLSLLSIHSVETWLSSVSMNLSALVVLQVLCFPGNQGPGEEDHCMSGVVYTLPLSCWNFLCCEEPGLLGYSLPRAVFSSPQLLSGVSASIKKHTFLPFYLLQKPSISLQVFRLSFGGWEEAERPMGYFCLLSLWPSREAVKYGESCLNGEKEKGKTMFSSFLSKAAYWSCTKEWIHGSRKIRSWRKKIAWVNNAFKMHQTTKYRSLAWPSLNGLRTCISAYHWAKSSNTSLLYTEMLTISHDLLKTVLKAKNRVVVSVQNGCKHTGSLPSKSWVGLRSVAATSPPHSPGKDHNSKSEVEFLLNMNDPLSHTP